MSFRESMLAATMARRGCDRAEAEVILDRIADRLDGFSHDEAAKRNPLPLPAPAAATKEERA